jgi:hypothetical protein
MDDAVKLIDDRLTKSDHPILSPQYGNNLCGLHVFTRQDKLPVCLGEPGSRRRPPVGESGEPMIRRSCLSSRGRKPGRPMY